MVAELDGTAAGLVMVAPGMFGNSVIISALYVHLSCQRRGIGTAFLDDVLSQYPKAVHISLEVLAKNQRAIAYYARYGCRKAHPWFTFLGVFPSCIMKMERSQVATSIAGPWDLQLR